MRQKVTALIAAGGMGRRLGTSLAKPLVRLGGVPIIVRTLSLFSGLPLIDDIVVAFNRSDIPELKRLIRKHGIPKISRIVAGGKTRRQSVENALKQIRPSCSIVAIHDGARPFTEAKVISAAIRAAAKHGAAVVAVPVKPTIKRVDTKKGFVEGTLKREILWEAQTPQVFKKDIIVAAHRSHKEATATDDACLVEKLGIRVKVVAGSYTNIKITTPEDLIFSEALLKKRRR